MYQRKEGDCNSTPKSENGASQNHKQSDAHTSSWNTLWFEDAEVLFQQVMQWINS